MRLAIAILMAGIAIAPDAGVSASKYQPSGLGQAAGPLAMGSGVVDLRLLDGDLFVRYRSIEGFASPKERVFHAGFRFLWAGVLGKDGSSIDILFRDHDGTSVISRFSFAPSTEDWNLREIWRGDLAGAPDRLIATSDGYWLYGLQRLVRLQRGRPACEVVAVRRAGADAISAAVHDTRFVVRKFPGALVLDIAKEGCRAKVIRRLKGNDPILRIASAGATGLFTEQVGLGPTRLTLIDWSGNRLGPPLELAGFLAPLVAKVGEAAVLYEFSLETGYYVHGTRIVRISKPAKTFIADSLDDRLLVWTSEDRVGRIDTSGLLDALPPQTPRRGGA